MLQTKTDDVIKDYAKQGRDDDTAFVNDVINQI